MIKIIQKSLFWVLLFLTLLFVDTRVAFAHTPHDDISQLEISPTYEQDQTLFIIVRGNLLKSENGGFSWQRIVKGLDHKHRFSTLDISSQSSKTLFLSSKEDGIYKSEDGGSSWFKVNQGLETLNIDLVAISSNNSEVVLAAGTEKGLYKTENGGKNWEQVIGDNRKITAIAYFPDRQDQMLIGDRQGNLYLSEDGGNVWQPLSARQNSGAINAIAVSPNFASDNTLFVGTEKGGILKSVDGGSSFSEVNNEIPKQPIMSLVMSPNYATDSTVLASTWKEGVFQSNDGGKSWQKYSKGLTTNAQADELKRPNFSYLSISKAFNNDKTVFLAGFDGLFKSTDGGHRWQGIETLSSKTIVDLEVSPDYENDSTVAIGTYLWGHYLSEDGGTTWKPINKGLEEGRPNGIARVFNLIFSPNYSSDNTIFSTTWYHFLKSTNRGKGWQEIQPMGKTGKFILAVSPAFASDRTVYLGTKKGDLLKSTDGGDNFSQIGNIGQEPLSLIISPNFSADRTIYAGVRGGVYKTVDGGATWQSANNGLTLTEESDAILLTISPNYQADGTVFAGTTEGIFKTENGGESWDKLAGNAYGNDGYLEAIALSPDYQKDKTLIVSVRGRGLFKSINGGKTFTQIGEELLANNIMLGYMDGFRGLGASRPIQFSPSYSSDRTIYGFSGTELFKSEDGGNTWAAINIPTPDYNFITNSYLAYHNFKRSSKRIFIAALIAALLSYLFIGYLRLEKKLPLNRLQLKAGGAFVAFILVFTFLSLG